MFEHELLHDRNRQQLQAFIASGNHALLISAPAGAGKKHIIHQLTRHYKISEENILVVDGEGGSIGIEQIRALKKDLTLKSLSSEQIRRIVVVNDAENMTTEAQNAFLKLLEEPPEDTLIFLTENGSDNLADTVYSRVQRINILPVKQADVVSYFQAKSIPMKEIDRAYALTGGLLGQMQKILLDSEGTPLTDQIELAKNILKMKPYDRLVNIEEYSKDKDVLTSIIFILRQISRSALRAALAKNETAKSKSWLNKLNLILETENALKLGANPKLTLTNLLVNL